MRTKVYEVPLLGGMDMSEQWLFVDLLEDHELDAEVGGLGNPIGGASDRADV